MPVAKIFKTKGMAKMGIKRSDAWWMVSLLSVASLAAASDLRLVEAVKKGDKEAVRSLLKQHADVNAPRRMARRRWPGRPTGTIWKRRTF